MGKREVAASLYTSLLGLGGLAVITALTLASEQPYRNALLIFGVLACVMGLGGLIWLYLLTPESERDRIRKASLKRKEDIVLGLTSPQRDPGDAEAARKNELATKRARERQSPNDWIPFHEALRYLVYQSQWAANQPPVKDEKEFNRVVSAEVRERIARGDLATRGQLGWDKQSERATESIATEFWIDAFFVPFGIIALANGQDAICKQGGGAATYQRVIVRKGEVERAWPSGSGQQLTTLALFVEDRRAEIASEKAPSDDEFSDEWEWLVAKQEGRTKVERDKPLGEALAYTVLGRWGAQFFHAVAEGLVKANDPLKGFEQLAYDGRLHVWGKSERHRDLYEEIPREHWKNNQVEWFDLLRGRPRTEPRGQTGDAPYYDLMVSRAEFEEVLRYVKPN